MSPSYGIGAQFSRQAPPLASMPQPCHLLASRGRRIIPRDRDFCLMFASRSCRFQSCPAKPRKVEHEFYEDDEYERDSSLDDGDSMLLLVQLVRTILRKMSARATKAARGMLPPIFTLDLISFFVNGALWLTLFWVAKALLEVVCSMGSMMFIGLLLVRSLWSILSYLQSQRYEDSTENGNSRHSDYRRSNNRWGGGSGSGDFDDHQYRTSPS